MTLHWCRSHTHTERGRDTIHSLQRELQLDITRLREDKKRQPHNQRQEKRHVGMQMILLFHTEPFSTVAVTRVQAQVSHTYIYTHTQLCFSLTRCSMLIIQSSFYYPEVPDVHHFSHINRKGSPSHPCIFLSMLVLIFSYIWWDECDIAVSLW